MTGLSPSKNILPTLDRNNIKNNSICIFKARLAMTTRAACFQLKWSIMKNITLSVLLLLNLCANTSAQVYPSAGTAWVLPGYQQPAEHANFKAQFDSANAVSRWENEHADISIGGHYKGLTAPKITRLGYMYNQKLEWSMGEKELQLRSAMEQAGLDYESLFLHFQEDTRFGKPQNDHGSATPLRGQPEMLAIQFPQIKNIKRLRLHKPELQFENAPVQISNGTHLYLLSSERLDGVQLTLSTIGGENIRAHGTVSISIATQGDENAWRNVLTQRLPELANHKQLQLNWQPPLTWSRANFLDYQLPRPRAFPAISELPPNKGELAPRFFLIKLSFSHLEQPLILNQVRLQPWYQLTPATAMIPGWDPVNDINQDGYIDDNEFAQRANSNASARFPYQARLVPLGRMWSKYSSFCFTNIFPQQNKTLLIAFLTRYWQKMGYQGAYNDSLLHIPSKHIFPVTQGGKILELQQSVTDVAKHYWQSFSQLNQQLHQETQSPWIGANISAINLFGQSDQRLINQGFRFFVREDYIYPSLGLNGRNGLLQRWENFALAAQQKSAILMAHMRKGGQVKWRGNQARYWQHDQLTNLAIFYLLNVPERSFYQQWNGSFSYSSQNTQQYNYYAAGIPHNVAYQPTALLEYDIGAPMPAPSNYPKVNYLDSQGNILSDSSSKQVMLQGQRLALIPSEWFYLFHEPDIFSQIAPISVPDTAIIARQYQRALILFHTDKLGNNILFSKQKSPIIPLPQAYRRLNFDGSKGPVIQHIQLQGYEGVILIPEKP